jgi:hypothetical protein
MKRKLARNDPNLNSKKSCGKIKIEIEIFLKFVGEKKIKKKILYEKSMVL